ncbi:ABC transporter permease [bacterium]|uniref:ABC transporter permease n=1 Tax=Fusicatenibacter saccharivorans TaxID=1150298 RepID=UPI002A7916CA|nr:ABC transporter permease [bacterium]MCI7149368.1 ABC transporter permease [bacterium]MDY2884699.1 ABC transporter permease [Bariatricus sp.]MDY4504650.1 ABC transporter permease [Bariatricus sp.]
MLFKMSVKNIRKSIKDYTIYFLTLILGVAIFYMFNSLDSQEAMLVVNSSTRQIVKLMVGMINYVSVFVAVILGFLIVYANNFLIKRRKREFGLYMTLGMGKRQISGILLGETFLIGLISLVVGLVIGVFGSQLMSILVAKLFQADMSEYQFVFSEAACWKTCAYFGVMYAASMVLNIVIISRYKLIDLISAEKKNEKVRMKNPVICVLVFLAAAVTLGTAYYMVTGGLTQLDLMNQLVIPILMGIVSTFLIFWSVSGLALKVVQMRKGLYLKDSNIFVLRQIHNRINTTVVSMTIICLLLFMTITVLSTALSLNRVLTQDLEEMTPVDLNLYKTANLPDNGNYTQLQIEDSQKPISDTLKENGLDMKVLKDVTEVATYTSTEWTWETSLQSVIESAKENYPMLMYDTAEEIIKLSDYNKIARLYGNREYELAEDEYLVLCDFDNMKNLRDMALKNGSEVAIGGKVYHSRYPECQEGYLVISTSHTNTGLMVVPDSCPLSEDMKERYYLMADYNADTKEEKYQTEAMFTNYGDGDHELMENLEEKQIRLDGVSKISIIESSKGLSTIISFIAIYLGIIFLIASSAILALKELTENSDNRHRYTILRKIGMDEKMIHQTLFRQIGIFFMAPLVLAVVHSIFGIQFALKIVAVQVETREMLPSVIATAVFLILVYGGYFLATYMESKNIIREA